MDNSSLMVMKWNHIWHHRWHHITKKLLSPFKREHAKLDDMVDTRMKSILSQYIQAKRDHEYMIYKERQKEQYHSQKDINDFTQHE